MFSSRFITDRRQFLIGSSSVIAAQALKPAPLFAQSSQTSDPRKADVTIPTHDTVLKFNRDGTPRPFAGNTVICHLPPQCTMRDAMMDFHQALTRASFCSKLGLTPSDSYHMTIFPGANDQNRSIYGWPSYVPLNASIDVCNQMVAERMEKARFRYTLPIRVRVDVQATVRNSPALSLRLMPMDAAEERNLRALRDQLSEVYGFRLPDHATYGFHMTMSYQVAPFTPQDQDAYAALVLAHSRNILAAEAVLELGAPEYCTFKDMYRFEPVHLLGCA